MKPLLCALALAGSFLTSASVQAAEPVQIAHQGTQGLTLYTSDTGDYLTGGMQYLLQTGGSFEAFCIETAQDANAAFTGYNWERYEGTTAALMQGLFSSSYAGLSTDLERAAFQLAVWEITHETSNVLDVSYEQGSFFFVDFDRATAEGELIAFERMANEFLVAAASYRGMARYELFRLTNTSFQDLVAARPVPEPGSYALMLAGLGLLGWARRRRA